MRLTLSPPPSRYDAEVEQRRNGDLEWADRDNVKRWDLPSWVLDPGFMQSPNGTRWRLVVSDAGVLTVVAV